MAARSYIRKVGTGNIYNESDEFMAGQIIFCASSAIPSGYLECNGATVSRTTYATLFAAIGTAYGAGDGATTFNIPDLRGEFVRGADRGRGVDGGRVVGSSQADAYQGHRMQVVLQNTIGGAGTLAVNTTPGFNGPNVNNTAGTLSAQTTTHLTDGVNGAPRVAAETRGRNVALIPVIKYS